MSFLAFFFSIKLEFAVLKASAVEVSRIRVKLGKGSFLVGGSGRISLKVSIFIIRLLFNASFLIFSDWVWLLGLAYSRILFCFSTSFFSTSTTFFIQVFISGVVFSQAINHLSCKKTIYTFLAIKESSIFFYFLEWQCT